MAEPKTKVTNESVDDFLDAIADDQTRADCRTLVKIMRSAAKAAPKMWGTSIVGFGSYHYIYASGQEGDWPRVAFSPRKQSLSVYLMPGFAESGELLKKLGRHKVGKSCLYIKRLADVDLPTLKTLIRESLKRMSEIYPE